MMKMIWSLDYVTYSSSLTTIALLVCSEILVTLGYDGRELLFSGKECKKVTFLLTTPSTVMESPFFYCGNSPSTVSINECSKLYRGGLKLGLLSLYRGLKVHVTWHLSKANHVFHKGAVMKTCVIVCLKLVLVFLLLTPVEFLFLMQAVGRYLNTVIYQP